MLFPAPVANTRCQKSASFSFRGASVLIIR